MVVPLVAAAIVAAPIIAGAMSQSATEEDQRRAVTYTGKGLEAYNNVKDPSYGTIGQISYDDYKYMGGYDPTTLQAVDLGPSEMEGIALDPQLRAAQMQALQQLQDVSSQGGMTAIDRARLNQMQTGVNQQERGNREAIMQNMRQRGISGSGLELAASLSNQQSAADRANTEGLNVEAMAQQRALDAMMQAGSLGGSIRGQDFGEQSAKAQAIDAINRFNATNTQDVRTKNWGAVNDAGMAGWNAKQDIANRNVDIRNQNTDANVDIQKYGNTIKGQAFSDSLAKAGGIANSWANMGAAYGKNAAATAQTYNSAGQGVSQGAAAYGGYKASEKKEGK